ncbi:ral guanine nucleotide dissociation stimulator-like 3 [Tachyglossus aculeatus]|uniref:ral guanine nucleotide dissociation stimulator-like 3 n=1 Tax=Tachyglossus aculeatus TaxID=9261 RepID=UPI0018F3614A|nr:ral guanine nucleotide dissociation stimulator-like 3 [Tachyglossus aculeatus]
MERPERPPGKELAMTPLQEWGEETEDGVVYSVTLRRLGAGPRTGSARGQAPPSPGLTPTSAFVLYRTCKVRTLKAGRLDRLVEELVSGDQAQDPTFVPVFLATHRAFTSTPGVLELLLPLSNKSEGESAKETTRPLGGSQGQKQRAVLATLGSWLRDQPEDFREPPAHPALHQVCAFLSCLAPGGTEEREAKQLLSRFLAEEVLQEGTELEEEEKEEEEEEEIDPAGSSVQVGDLGKEQEGVDSLEKGLDLLDFSTDKVAEQLTLMDVELFRRVRPSDCLGRIWSQRDRGPRGGRAASSVRATVAQFNAVTGCVITSVLGDPTLRPALRALRLDKWIRVAQHCRELRNFSSLRAILSALQSNPVYRLKRSWAAVSREPLSVFRKLSQIFSDENNHLSSREILTQEEMAPGPLDGENSLHRGQQDPRPELPPGPVPYLGTFLTDLIMLDTALPDLVEGELINFEKRRKEWEILSRIQQLQRRCLHYSLTPCPPILAAFRGHRQLSEEQSYRISRIIEPPASSCPNSPKVRRSLTKRLSAKLSRECSSSPGRRSGDPSSPTAGPSWENAGSPPLSSPREREPPTLSPPASPKEGGGSKGSKCSLELTLGPETATTGLSSRGPTSPVGSARPGPPGQHSPDACIIRISVDNDHGNLYRSILLTSQDKTPGVVLRALQKHNLDGPQPRGYQLFQVLPGNKELLIPDNANVFYAMSPAAPGDFVLRRKEAPCPLPTS